MDLHHEGYITHDDLLQLLGSEYTDEQADQMIATIDQDGDGKIDFHEFLDCMHQVVHNHHTQEEGKARSPRGSPRAARAVAEAIDEVAGPADLTLPAAIVAADAAASVPAAEAAP